MPKIDLKELLSRFAATISQGPLGVVEHEPASWAQPMHFIQNVLLKVKRDGGSALYGWVFLNRGSAHGEYLIAMHHAIWNPVAAKAPIDISPFHEDPKYQPFCPTRGKVLFLTDEAAEPRVIGGAIYPLPSKFFPVTDDPDLVSYVEQLNGEEQTHFQRLSEGALGQSGSQSTH